jgi:hypothetical protein
VEQPSSRAAGTADKLMTVDEKWLHKNKDHGMMSAAASLGLILLWDVDEGLSQVRLEPFRPRLSRVAQPTSAATASAIVGRSALCC